METGAAERVTVYPLGIEFEFGAHFQGAAEDELRKLAENGAISVYIDDDADTPIILDIDGYEYIVKE